VRVVVAKTLISWDGRGGEGRERNDITLRIGVEKTLCLKFTEMFTNKMTPKVKLSTIVKRVFVLPLLGSSERENPDV
jgi:hypothetical protein